MKNIISIHGVPRSGTSWLGQLIDSNPDVCYKFQPLFSNTFRNKINLSTPNTEILKVISEIANTEDDFIDRVIEKENGIHYKFDKKSRNPNYFAMKHVRYHYLIPKFLELREIKILAIVRNPCGVLNSWQNAPKEFRNSDGSFVDEWYYGMSRNNFSPDEFFGFNKWKELTTYFVNIESNYPEKLHIIRYEDLVLNTKESLFKIFKFIGIPFDNQTRDYIDISQKKHVSDVYSTFKGNMNVNDWQISLDSQIIEKIYAELSGTELERFIQ